MGEPKTLDKILEHHGIGDDGEHEQYTGSREASPTSLKADLLAWARARELRYGERVLAACKDQVRDYYEASIRLVGFTVDKLVPLPEPETEQP